jgi:flagellar protein FlaG
MAKSVKNIFRRNIIMDVNRISTYQPQAAPAAPAQPETPAPSAAVQIQAAVQPEQTTPAINEGVTTPDPLRRAVASINSSLAVHGRHLSIHMHEGTGRRVVTVYNSDTNEVVREIPPDRVLDAHANVLEMVGLLMDTRG